MESWHLALDHTTSQLCAVWQVHLCVPELSLLICKMGLLDQISSRLLPALKCDSTQFHLLVRSLVEAYGSFFILASELERAFSQWSGLMAGVMKDSSDWVL